MEKEQPINSTVETFPNNSLLKKYHYSFQNSESTTHG